MRRFFFIVCIVGSLASTGAPVKAQGVSFSQHQFLTHLLAAQLGGSGRSTLVHHELTTLAVGNAPAGQSATATRLPPSVFSPATINSSLDGVADNSTADNLSFRPNHSQPFENQGRVTGYYERADWNPTGSDPIYFRYQSDIFGSASQAQASWQDAVTYTQSQTGASSQNCTSGGSNCQILGYNSSDGTTHYLDSYIQINQCMAETESQYSTNSYSNYSSTITSTLANIDAAAVSLLSSVCSNNPSTPPPTNPPPTATPVPTTPPPTTTPPPANLDFGVISVRAQASKKSDWNLVNPPVTQAKIGTTVYVMMYWIIRSAPSGIRPTYHIDVRYNGQVLAQQDYTGSQSSYGPDSYSVYVPFQLAKVGTYQFTWSVTINGTTQKSSTSVHTFKTVKRPIAKISFAFSRMQIQNTNGQRSQTFRPGQMVVISATYTVRNVRGTTPITISKTLQIQSGGSWKAVSNNLETQDTSSGQHFYRSSFQLSPTLAIPDIRIVLGITINSHTQSKKAIIHISR